LYSTTITIAGGTITLFKGLPENASRCRLAIHRHDGAAVGVCSTHSLWKADRHL
jgi:hypothetical protein